MGIGDSVAGVDQPHGANSIRAAVGTKGGTTLVVATDVAGARFVSRYHRLRIRETVRHPG
jgi:hypothetical protein